MARPRLGVADLSVPGWTASRSYTEAVMRSLVEAGAADRYELLRLTTDPAPAFAGLPFAPRLFAPTVAAQVTGRLDEAVPGALRHPLVGKVTRRLGAAAGRAVGWPANDRAAQLIRAGSAAGLSVLLPVTEMPLRADFATVGWVPDFQHVHQPGFFSADDRQRRDVFFRALAANATRVILSSRDSLDHFRQFTPEHAGKASVASFPSLLAFRELPAARGSAVRRYHLPPRFALVINQLWAHKNPEVVVEAVAQARDAGVRVPLVLIGTPCDYRDPENTPTSRLLQLIAERGLSGQAVVLGKVAYADLIDLLRCAAVLIQPSRFEGWSTSVQDAKALGRPLLCSDLPVHREQAPGALGFFGCDDAPALARLLIERFPGLPAGDEAPGEGEALAAERVFARSFGEALLRACDEAVGDASRGRP